MTDILAARYPAISVVVQYEDMTGDPASILESIASICGLGVNDVAVPEIGNDRDCARPYRHLIDEALAS